MWRRPASVLLNCQAPPQSHSVTCPSCQLENPPSALSCACGYEFVSGSRTAKAAASRTGPDAPGRLLRECLRPSWVKVGASLACAAFFGFAGLFVYIENSCWGGGRDCVAYSPVGEALGYAMAWTVILFARDMKDWFPAAPVLWAYYYLLFALVEAVIRSIRVSRDRG